MTLILRWLISTLAILTAAYVVDGITISGFYIALVVALVLGFVNAVIRPLVIILTLPINIITLGFFVFVINGMLLWFISTFIKGFNVESLTAAIFGSLIISVFSWAGNALLSSGRANNLDY